MASLDLGIIGNCSYMGLIDKEATVVWSCLPRFDSDPVFCHLLNNDADKCNPDTMGFYTVELDGFSHSDQSYIKNTAVLKTLLHSSDGACIEIIDFAPRFRQFGRDFRPAQMVRIIRPLAGKPRIRVKVRPAFDYNATRPTITHGSNHIRYVGPDHTLRLTSDGPVTYVLSEEQFFLEEPMTILLGPDESISSSITDLGQDFLAKTLDYWRQWVRHLAIPFEWQAPVIRAAITLKMCVFEDTGAIIAAATTSIPEFADSGRNWDYRYCWLRDAFFVVRALNRLGAVNIMEQHLRYLSNIVAIAEDGILQPVYGIGLEKALTERIVETLPGYRGMGPVRVGNQAFEHSQHDIYGQVIMATTQAFFDERLIQPASVDLFHHLEPVGETAWKLYNRPDAGLWELRTRARVHTSSTVMCWAACDRLAHIAERFNLDDRAALWRERADSIGNYINKDAWNDEMNSFVESMGGSDIDASLLLMSEVNFVPYNHPRMVGTMAAIEKHLKRGQHLLRYNQPDDFGAPENAFNICTFWYIEALAGMGRDDEAREIFENMLSSCNHLGLLSEDTNPETGELWGNYPQTYSLVGIINCAMRLTKRWEDVL